MKELKHTSYQLIAAEYFNCAVDDVAITLLSSFRFQKIYQLKHHEQIALIKILPEKYKQSELLDYYDFQNEVTTLQILKTKTKLLLPEILEYNPYKDLLPNEYLLLSIPEHFEAINELEEETLQQMTSWAETSHSISQNSFSMNSESNETFSNWSDCFERRWSLLLQELVACQLINDMEFEYSEKFYQAFSEVLNFDAQPVLTLPGLTRETLLFNPLNSRVLPFEFTLGQFAPPEFSLARADYYQISNWPLVADYKSMCTNSMTLKARYFLYYISFLLEDFLLIHLSKGDWGFAMQKKEMALKLIENALGE